MVGVSTYLFNQQRPVCGGGSPLAAEKIETDPLLKFRKK